MARLSPPPDRLRRSTSPLQLRDSCILPSHCKSIAFSSVGEFGPAGSHGFWAGRLVVAIPPAETGDDPGEPGKRAWRMWILLALGSAFERGADGFGRSDEIFVGD